MSLYHRCACPNNREQDCEHPWSFKFKFDGRVVQKTTKHTSRQKAAIVEIKAHAKLLDEGTGVARSKAPRLKQHIDDYLVFAKADHPATAEEKDERILLPAAKPVPGAKVDKRQRDRGPSFLEVVGDKRLDHIGPFDIERWRSARLKVPIAGGGTVSRSTVNRDLNIIRGCFRQAVVWKRLKASPVDDVEVWEVDDTPVQILTADERVTVLTKLPPRFALYCRVTLEALPRIAEVLRLKRGDLGDASITRRLKGGKVAAVPVSRALIADLRRWLTTTDEQEYVFAEADGQPPKPRSTASLMTKAFRAIGLPHVHHHVMRHTGITDMLEDGISPVAIKEYAGWTSLRMLERYGHLRDAELLRATAGTAARNTAALAEGARRTAQEQAAAAQGGTDEGVGTKVGTSGKTRGGA